MQRSSSSVAALAAALAKAQAELTNPEKSLLAILPAERGQAERSFRYAPLSGGLDIVRKTLGKHEIAAVQTTAIDPKSGAIMLSTTLAHSSGEWIASDWPVCRLAELASPQRMGAALTYARRYSLFTLVGIAGEDDIDAPDLPIQVSPVRQDPPAPPSSPPQRRNGRALPLKRPSTFEAEESLVHRDRLLTEIAVLTSVDQAVLWTKQALPIKNRLIRAHAEDVEAAFQGRMEQLTMPQEAEPRPATIVAAGENKGATSKPVEMALPIAHQPRRRDKQHLRFVASQPCLLCDRRPADAHHLRFAQPKALGRKVSDEFTVPLCRTHHRQLHQAGNEAEWWHVIDPDINLLEVARTLWEQSHSGVSHASSTVGAMALDSSRLEIDGVMRASDCGFEGSRSI
jgi:hypothetical protein